MVWNRKGVVLEPRSVQRQIYEYYFKVMSILRRDVDTSLKTESTFLILENLKKCGKIIEYQQIKC